MKLNLAFAIPAFLACVEGCTEKPKYPWAFAQDLDGTVRENESCRTSLANSVIHKNMRNEMVGDDAAVFVFHGNIESYKVYAFTKLSDCEVALRAKKQPQR